jgi:hypothetical protein
LCTSILLFIGLWHLKFPPLDGHQPKSWLEVYLRVAIGILFVLMGIFSVIITLWMTNY